MKSCLNMPDLPEPEPTQYPCLKYFCGYDNIEPIAKDTGMVVLFSSKNCGTVVYTVQTHNSWVVGDYSEDWDEYLSFAPLPDGANIILGGDSLK